MKLNLRLLYLYLFSFVGLIITVMGAIRLFELGLKVFVFKEADKYSYYEPAVPDAPKVSTDEAETRRNREIEIQEKETKRQRQREAAGALAMLLVGFPLYKYHWGVIQKEHKKEN